MAEMLNYEPHLRSMSGGRGSYSMEFSHYEELPGALGDKVVAEARKDREAKAAEKH
jgi:elongation factor G